MPGYVEILLGILLIYLGCSFAYKLYLAGAQGQVRYWSGFLPIGIISPFLIHLPAGKNSLIKSASGLWVNFLLAPIFLVCSALCFAAGAEYLGMPGVASLNWIMKCGDSTRGDALSFDKQRGYSCPLLKRASGTLGDRINRTQIPLNEKDKLY